MGDTKQGILAAMIEDLAEARDIAGKAHLSMLAFLIAVAEEEARAQMAECAEDGQERRTPTER